MKRLLFFVTLTLCFSMTKAQIEVHLPNDPNFSMKCKTGQILKYTITSKKETYTVTVNGIKGDKENIKKIEIPATVNYRNIDYNVTAINNEAFADISTMTSVTIPQSIKTIGAKAFIGCTSLKTIKIGGIIEYCGENAFSETAISKPIYTGKTLVYYPANQKAFKINEGTETILEYAFSDCKELTSIVIPSSVRKLSINSFANCNNLENIVVAEGNKTFDSRNNCNAIILTSEDKIIRGCKNSSIPDGIKTIGRLSFANTNLSQIEIPNSVTAIEDSAFYNCELSSITIPESVKKIGANAFVKNKKLAVVNFNAIDCDTMEEKFPAFEQCMSLTSVNFGDNVKIIPAYSFKGCTEIRYATLSNSVKKIGKKAFSECKMLSYLELPNSVEKVDDSCFYESGISEPVHSEILFAYFPPNYDTEYSIPEGIKTIAQKSFHYARNLKSVAIPNSVTKIEELAFAECTGLETVVMSTNIETIEPKSFWYCPKLKEITLPNTLKCIENELFMGDQGLESIVIPNSVIEIKKHSFYDSGLKTVTLPKSINSIYKTAFKECPNLKYIYIPKGTTEQFKRLLEPEYHSKLKEE